MKIKNVRENFVIYIKLAKKKVKDMKLRKKIYLVLFTTVILSCLSIGIISYRIAGNAIIDNSVNMMTNLMKQVGLNLDERITTFQDVSYRILQTSSVSVILNYDREEAGENRNSAGSTLNRTILQQNSLYQYTKYALLRPANGVITEYYRSRQKKMTEEEEAAVLDYLEQQVSIARPIRWVVYGDDVYFVRKIVQTNGKENGLLCFAMTDAFFEFVGTEQTYISNDFIAIIDEAGEKLKSTSLPISDGKLLKLRGYHDNNYYTYHDTLQMATETYSVVALNTIENNWTMISFMPYSEQLRAINRIYLLILVTICIVLCCSVAVTYLISKSITRNVAIIEQGMKNYEEGNFTVRIKPDSYDEIGLLALQLNYMGLRISDLIHMVEEKEEAKRKSEYQTLQAQINPHFLYNTLGSIRWAAFRRGEEETAQTVDALISLLRFTIKRAAQILPLKEELDYIQNYLTIEKVRYGENLRVVYEIDETLLQWRLPGFMLQPFVENSLLHGLDMTREDPCITIRAKRNGEFLQLEIEDNGVGMDEETLNRIWTSEEKDVDKGYQGFNSIGIKIVYSRMQSYYGDRFSIDIFSQIDEGTRTVIQIPEEANVQDSDRRR